MFLSAKIKAPHLRQVKGDVYIYGYVYICIYKPLINSLRKLEADL